MRADTLVRQGGPIGRIVGPDAHRPIGVRGGLEAVNSADFDVAKKSAPEVRCLIADRRCLPKLAEVSRGGGCRADLLR